MTIVFQLGNNFWIETFEQARVQVNAGTDTDVDFTLSRSGLFLGAAITIDNNSIAAVTVLTAVTVKKTDDSTLGFGDAINTIRVVKHNGDGSARTFGFHLIVLMRGRGG